MTPDETEVEIMTPSSLNPEAISTALKEYLPTESLEKIGKCQDRESAVAQAYAELIGNGFTDPSSVLLGEGLISKNEVLKETPPDVPLEILEETNREISSELNV